MRTLAAILMVLLALPSAIAVIPANPGDLNNDNRVDVSDVFLIVNCLGQNAATCQSGRADPNNDGAVNIYDFIAVSKSWGTTYSSGITRLQVTVSPANGNTATVQAIWPSAAGVVSYQWSTGRNNVAWDVDGTTAATGVSVAAPLIATSESAYFCYIGVNAQGTTIVPNDCVGYTLPIANQTGPSDSVKPSVALSAPASGATVSGSTTVSATASDNVGVLGVQFLLDGNNLAAEDTSAPFSISWDTATTTNAQHTLSARARDAAGNTNTSTTRTVTVSNMVTSPPSGNPNEPAGYTAITNNPLSSVAYDGWYADSGSPTLATDSGAPVSPSTIMRANLAAGYDGGGAPWSIERPLSGYTEVYWNMAFKYSANWDGHKDSVNKLGFVWQHNNALVVLVAEGTDNGPLQAVVKFQGSPAGEFTLYPNKGPSGTISRGAWHSWEVQLISNTGGNANGVVRWWLDGTLIGEYTNVSFASASQSHTFELTSLFPIWGGTGDTVTNAMTLDYDHVYLSGKSTGAGGSFTPGNLASLTFEDGTYNGLTNGGGANPPSSAVATGGAYQGTRYMEFTSSGGSGDQGLNGYWNGGSSHDDLWLVVAIKVTTTPSQGLATQKTVIFRQAGYGTQLGEMNQIDGDYIWNCLDGGFNVPFAQVGPTRGQWNMWKFHYDFRPARPVITIWMNGVQVYTVSCNDKGTDPAIISFGGPLNGGSGASKFGFDYINIGTVDPGWP